MERLVLLLGSYFCDTLTFGICLYFLKSYITAGGCYDFRICVKQFLSIPIKFLFCKSLGWSATKWDGQTSSEKTVYVNQTGIFSFFLNQPQCWMEYAKSMETVKAGKSDIGSGVGNHLLEIYAALSAAFMPIAYRDDRIVDFFYPILFLKNDIRIRFESYFG